MISDEADKVIKKLFHSLKRRYQNHLEFIKTSEFVFDYVCSCIVNVKRVLVDHI